MRSSVESSPLGENVCAVLLNDFYCSKNGCAVLLMPFSLSGDSCTVWRMSFSLSGDSCAVWRMSFSPVLVLIIAPVGSALRKYGERGYFNAECAKDAEAGSQR